MNPDSLYEKILAHLRGGARVFLAGNGGSAAMAQHAAAELMVKYREVRDPLPAIALTADSAILTAHANDFGFETLFARQLQALVRAGDVVILMTTSGKSRNIILAAELAVSRGALVIALTGLAGLFPHVPDVLGRIFEGSTAVIQTKHLQWIHELCEYLDEQYS